LDLSNPAQSAENTNGKRFSSSALGIRDTLHLATLLCWFTDRQIDKLLISSIVFSGA